MENIFSKSEQRLIREGFEVISTDLNRPWGGFFVIDENQAQKFANIYFDGLNISELKVAGKLSPKLLLVKPGARLSWQYHFRRKETWSIIEGPVGIARSMTDEQGDIETFHTNEKVVMQEGERHRLIGLANWGVVAEFWQHTDINNPSNEEDIVRLQDDYQRSSQ